MSLVTPEQDLFVMETSQQYLAGPEIDSDLEFKLGRACVAHCFAASQAEVLGTPVSLTELTDFVKLYGAGSGSPYYKDGVGWRVSALADLMRLNGAEVIVQNLNHDVSTTDIEKATISSLVRSDFEKSRLSLLSEYGGQNRSKWSQALEATTLMGGLCVTSIDIPLLSGEGHGSHAVLITRADTEADRVTYFDPDYYNVARYGAGQVAIERIDETKLLYERPMADHLTLMSGTATHIFPSTRK